MVSASGPEVNTSNDCDSGYIRDGGSSSCIIDPNNCVASGMVVNTHTYSVPALLNGISSVEAISVSITNGSRAYEQEFVCSAGSLLTVNTETNTSNTCNSGYARDGSSCISSG